MLMFIEIQISNHFVTSFFEYLFQLIIQNMKTIQEINKKI